MRADWESAARRGDVAAMQEILGAALASGEILNSKNRHGQNALMMAAARGHDAVVELLIANGAELNHTAKFNLSALMLAVINNSPQIVARLVSAGADKEIRGTGAPGFYNKSAMDLAADRESIEMVRILAERLSPQESA